MPPLLHKCSVSVFQSYHNIFHSWCYIRFTYIIGTNVFQLQTPSHQSILRIFHFSPFLKKCIILAMCLVCLVSLKLLAIHISYLPSKTTKGASSGTMYGYLLRNSWIDMMKCAKSIPAVHASLYSLFALDQTTGPGTCQTCSRTSCLIKCKKWS